MAKENTTFEQNLKALEEIVGKLEQGDVPLEEALAEFQKGILLSKACQDTLGKAEKTVTKMMTDAGETQDFDMKSEE